MGAGGSTARRLTVHNDDPRIIQVSEDVVRRLKSSTASQQPPPEEKLLSNTQQETYSVPQVPRQENVILGFGRDGLPTIETISALEMRKQKEAELRENDKFWRGKLQDIEARYIKSEVAAGQEFSERLTRLSALVPQKGEDKCKELSLKVAECYKTNPTQTLMCSVVVKEFAKCVENGSTLT